MCQASAQKRWSHIFYILHHKLPTSLAFKGLFVDLLCKKIWMGEVLVLSRHWPGGGPVAEVTWPSISAARQPIAWCTGSLFFFFFFICPNSSKCTTCNFTPVHSIDTTALSSLHHLLSVLLYLPTVPHQLPTQRPWLSGCLVPKV